MFSLGVMLLATVRGVFPFLESSRSDPWFELLVKEKYEEYFSKIDEENRLSEEFKDLVVSMLRENGSERPNVDQIRAHPWM